MRLIPPGERQAPQLLARFLPPVAPPVALDDQDGLLEQGAGAP